ncbi:MAG: hypothetical protein IJ729_08775 [Alloprevotella sp.]|nr:hypothetical protein [Alloprevotella sp.]MBR1733805.1 hypothetical protein [Alloprevotella sp.]
MEDYNPIRSVDGAAIKCPSAYQWKLSDVSAADAGRTEDTVMDKMRIGQCVHLELSWQNLKNDEVSAILKAFNPEYITVCYLDAMEGIYVTREFYVGDRSAPMYNCALGIWSNVSFNIIQRDGRV